MSLQDVTGFKPGTAFTALIHAYGNIRMGIEAYQQLVAKNLNDVLNVIDDALSIDPNFDPLPGEVMVPIYNDLKDQIRVTTISQHDLARCLQNDGQDFNVNVHAVVDSIPTNMQVSSSTVIDYFSRYVDQCAGMKSLLTQIVNSDFNLTFSQLYPTTIKGGSETSEWLSSLIESVSGSTNVLKVLSNLLSSQTETPQSKSDYIFKADYTNGNSLMVGFNAIADDVTTFFDGLDFDITKLGDSLKQLGIKIIDALKYLLSNAFVELNQHFVINNNAKFETCDVPVIYSTFVAGELVSDFSHKFVAQRYYFTDNSGFADVTVDTTGIHLQQEIESCIISVLQSILNNGNLVIPVAGNFVLLSLPNGYNKTDPLLTTVYCGVYPIGISVPFSAHQYKADIVNNVIIPQSTGPMYPVMEASSQRNEDVINFIIRSISHDSTIIGQSIPFGSNLETPNLFGAPVNANINLNSPTKGGDLISDYRNSNCGENLSYAVRFAVYATIYYCIASNLLDQIIVTADIRNSDNSLVKTIRIYNPGFLPYCHTDDFECYIHAQTDTERANEVRDLITKVLIAAAAVSVSRLAYKTRKKLKLSAKSKRAMADQANWALQQDPENLDLAKDAVRAAKAANKAETLSNILNPVGIAKKIFSSFTAPHPSSNQESRDKSLSTTLQRFESKYSNDDILARVNEVKRVITG